MSTLNLHADRLLGRTARAVSNLELVRGGYPPIIIRKKERERYVQALAESDAGGDIRSFLELVLERIEGAITGLEPHIQQCNREQDKSLTPNPSASVEYEILTLKNSALNVAVRKLV